MTTRSYSILLFLSLLGSANLASQVPPVVIGVAADGPSGPAAQRLELYRTEIVRLLGSRYDVQMPADKTLTADWTAEGVSRALDRLYEDEEVDVVLALGVLSSNEAVRRPAFSKPTLCPDIFVADLQGAPIELRRGGPGGGSRRLPFHVSGVDNLVYTTSEQDPVEDIETLRRIASFDSLAFLVMKPLLDGIPNLEPAILNHLAALDLDVRVIAVDDSIEQAVSSIPDGAAAYVTPLAHLPPDTIQRLAAQLIQRKTPSFAMSGRPAVRQGLLAGLALEQDEQRLARRTALNLQAILSGEAAAELPVDFEHDRRLTLNMKTADAIGVYPTWSILTEAELLDSGEEPPRELLSLGDVVERASRVNLDISIADRNITAGEQRVQEARSPLLPQLNVSAQDVQIDKDRAQSSFGSRGQNQVSGSLTVTQLLYSEQARAGYSIEQSLQEGRSQDRDRIRLDVILEASQGYLNVLRAKTVERVQRDNLELTRRNLERARARRDLGAAGPGEVFRWENQIANNRKDLIAAIAARNQAEIQVNRVLNRPLEQGFETVEASLDDPELSINYEALRRYIDNRQGFSIFRRFLSGEAAAASPELKQLTASISAQERSVLAAKRAFYVPTVVAQADLTAYKNAGAGSTNPLESVDIPNFTVATPNSLNWQAGVNASLPLFQGGKLRAQRSRAEIELDRLTTQREAVRLRVEQRIRSSAHKAMASWAGIELAQLAADAARSNYDLVADAYDQGVVDIVRLLDAQNQALGAELAESNAVYEFLIDLMDVQRAVGGFDFFRSPEQRQALLDRLEKFFQEAGYAR